MRMMAMVGSTKMNHGNAEAQRISRRPRGAGATWFSLCLCVFVVSLAGCHVHLQVGGRTIYEGSWPAAETAASTRPADDDIQTPREILQEVIENELGKSDSTSF